MINLSAEQLIAIDKTGKFVLRACPGSGKTYTVTRRVFQRISQWKNQNSGLVILSFTQVAQAQISEELLSLGLSPNSFYPHFLGTIDHFINSFIFLPFGHLVMECSTRPSIVGLKNNHWNQEEHGLFWRNRSCHSCDFLNFSYDINGHFIGGVKNCPYNYQHCQNLKQRFARMGFATQYDAEYWSMEILKRFPIITKSLIKRFPELIIDEAQDTSDIQMSIIDLLVEKGLSQIMLVGDTDQAIYEWRDARPEIFLSKLHEKGWEQPLYLTQNRRSSQNICNFTKHFSGSLQQASIAVGNDADFPFLPRLIEYDVNSILDLKNDFIALCETNNVQISPDNIAILMRSNRQLQQIKHSIDLGNPWNHGITRLLAQSAFFRDSSNIPISRQLLEAALSRIMFGNQYFSNQELLQYLSKVNLIPKWRIGVWQLQKILPFSQIALRDWLVEATRVLQDWFATNNWPVINHEELKLKVKQFQLIANNRTIAYFDEPLTNFFNNSNLVKDGITIETIHSAKGKNYDAVLFVVNDSIRGKGNIKQIIEKELVDEEVRTAYVAMTRPRKILVIAIPLGTDNVLLQKRFPQWMIDHKNLPLS
jgi:superfamily I DNA/RNA helicase